MKDRFILHKKFLYPIVGDWYPNKIRDTVEVSVMEWIYEAKEISTFRILAMGDDDYGLCKRNGLFLILKETMSCLPFKNPLT